MTAARIALALLVVVPPAAWGQSRVSGRVVRVAGRDTVPVRDIAVVLHRVGPRAQGPIDTARAGASGGFAFGFSPDTTSAYLLSARYGGIEYFSQPVATNPARPDTGVVLIVADTSSTAPVLVRQRTLLISRPDESGARTVLDWFVLGNPGAVTRVAPDTIRPAWGTPLPREALDVTLADNRMSQFAPEALVFRRDSALVFAPLSPGDKELMLQYRIRETLGTFIVPSAAVDSVFVLLEESRGRVGNPGFAPADSQLLDGRSFRRWAGTLSGPGEIEIVLPAPVLSSRQLLAALVVAVAAAFAASAWVVARRRRRGDPGPAFLADAIARLDERYLGREAESPAADWSRYRAERARLLAELERALATRGRRS